MLPVLASLAFGEIPGVLTARGIVAALGGAILASLQIGGGAQTQRLRPALLLALYAALGFGALFALLDQSVPATSRSALWVIAGARVGSVATILIIISLGATPPPGRGEEPASSRPPESWIPRGTRCYYEGLANLGVAAVLSSLCVTTVLLGIAVLKERFAPIQGLRVMLALLGVALISSS